MIRYKCPKCSRNQYTSNTKAENDACIYCGHQGIEPMKTLNDPEEELQRSPGGVPSEKPEERSVNVWD